jgi:hypothetical protein
MTTHKYVNVGLVATAFVLAFITAVLSTKDGDNAKQVGATVSEENKIIIHVNNAAIASAVGTAVLFGMAIGMFHFNNKFFGLVKAGLCVIVLILGLILIAFGTQILNIPSATTYSYTSIATGVVSLAAVGSCSLAVFKMLYK